MVSFILPLSVFFSSFPYFCLSYHFFSFLFRFFFVVPSLFVYFIAFNFYLPSVFLFSGVFLFMFLYKSVFIFLFCIIFFLMRCKYHNINIIYIYLNKYLCFYFSVFLLFFFCFNGYSFLVCLKSFCCFPLDEIVVFLMFIYLLILHDRLSLCFCCLLFLLIIRILCFYIFD